MPATELDWFMTGPGPEHCDFPRKDWTDMTFGPPFRNPAHRIHYASRAASRAWAKAERDGGDVMAKLGDTGVCLAIFDRALQLRYAGAVRICHDEEMVDFTSWRKETKLWIRQACEEARRMVPNLSTAGAVQFCEVAFDECYRKNLDGWTCIPRKGTFRGQMDLAQLAPWLPQKMRTPTRQRTPPNDGQINGRAPQDGTVAMRNSVPTSVNPLPSNPIARSSAAPEYPAALSIAPSIPATHPATQAPKSPADRVASDSSGSGTSYSSCMSPGPNDESQLDHPVFSDQISVKSPVPTMGWWTPGLRLAKVLRRSASWNK